MSKREYNTGNKTAVKDFFFQNRDRHFTIEEAEEGLSALSRTIPKSSLYRTVSSLCKAGYLRRFEAQGSDSFVYQYASFGHTCENHFHLKCTVCGKLIHLDCGKMNEIKEHVYKEHGFIIGGDGIINGVCKGCEVRK